MLWFREIRVTLYMLAKEDAESEKRHQLLRSNWKRDVNHFIELSLCEVWSFGIERMSYELNFLKTKTTLLWANYYSKLMESR